MLITEEFGFPDASDHQPCTEEHQHQPDILEHAHTRGPDKTDCDPTPPRGASQPAQTPQPVAEDTAPEHSPQLVRQSERVEGEGVPTFVVTYRLCVDGYKIDDLCFDVGERGGEGEGDVARPQSAMIRDEREVARPGGQRGRV